MPIYLTNRTPTFTPRTLSTLTEAENKPMTYFTPDIPKAENIWWWTDGTISSSQPALWEKRINQDGSVTPGVKKVWYGGGTAIISASEATILIAAGYGDCITYGATYDTSTYDSGDVFV